MIRTPDEFGLEKRPIQNSKNDFEIHRIFSKEELLGYASLFNEVVLQPGDLLPMHAHVKEAELFCVLEGELVSINADGSETPFLQGSYMITGNGDKHSLRNDSNKSAKILAIIVP